MRTLTVTAHQQIEAAGDVVRAQFGDVAHHAATSPHRGVRFIVRSDEAHRCSYDQITRVGPLRLRQAFELERTTAGPLVNNIVGGQFTGGTMSFDVEPTGPGVTRVTARLEAPLRGAAALLAPLLRRQVSRKLAVALDEDRRDLESGNYTLDRSRPEVPVAEPR